MTADVEEERDMPRLLVGYRGSYIPRAPVLFDDLALPEAPPRRTWKGGRRTREEAKLGEDLARALGQLRATNGTRKFRRV